MAFASLQCCCHSANKCSVLAGPWQGQTCSACVGAAEHCPKHLGAEGEILSRNMPPSRLCSYDTILQVCLSFNWEVCTINYWCFLNCKNASTCCVKMAKSILPSTIWGLLIFVLTESTNISVCVTVPILTVCDCLKLKLWLLGLTLWNPACWNYFVNKTLSEMWHVIIIKCS